MNNYKYLEVCFDEKKVGTLATTKNGVVAFEYDGEWLEDGFTISPFSLPLEKKVFIPKSDLFEGLFGVFSDSLPDGWGRLLVDRMLLKEHINPRKTDALNRLAIVGNTGMGALTYRPIHELHTTAAVQDYDRMAEQCRQMLLTDYAEDLDELFRLGGSSGGARPKILTEIEGEDWIVKFPASMDRDEIGLQEYEYAKCAKVCGIAMSEVKLFPSANCAGYFGTKRFDRFEETHLQRAYKEEEIINLLKKVGFENIKTYGDFTFESPKKDSERIFFVCKK